MPMHLIPNGTFHPSLWQADTVTLFTNKSCWIYTISLVENLTLMPSSIWRKAPNRACLYYSAFILQDSLHRPNRKLDKESLKHFMGFCCSCFSLLSSASNVFLSKWSSLYILPGGLPMFLDNHSNILGVESLIIAMFYQLPCPSQSMFWDNHFYILWVESLKCGKTNRYLNVFLWDNTDIFSLFTNIGRLE